MITKFYSFWFLLEMLIAIGFAFFGYLTIKYYWKPGLYEINREHFKLPTSTVLIVIGIVTPILTALASFLYVLTPEGQYISLLSAITLFTVTLIIAIWESFAIISLKSKNGNVELNIPRDYRKLIGLSWMYSFLLLGFIYLCIYFLFELEPPTKNKQVQLYGIPKVEASEMNGKKFFNEIEERKYPNENTEDLIEMINLIAKERAHFNHREISNADYQYAASIICILQPVKPPEYIEQIRKLRMGFKGIARNLELQKRFRYIMTTTLLKTKSPEQAIELGVNKLFKERYK